MNGEGQGLPLGESLDFESRVDSRRFEAKQTRPEGTPLRVKRPELSVVVTSEVPATLTRIPSDPESARTAEGEAAEAPVVSTMPLMVAPVGAPAVVSLGPLIELDPPHEARVVASTAKVAASVKGERTVIVKASKV